MQQQDQSEKIEVHEETEDLSEASADGETMEQAATGNANEAGSASNTDESVTAQAQQGRFNWPALVAALAVAAFFALTARFNNLPAPSYVPAAVFSATGCGLLVTAIRKLRKWSGAGLLEAGLSGFGMALLQFIMTFTYPGVAGQLSVDAAASRAFLITWILVALFAVVLSMAGATIGHLAFAPLRPLPARTSKRRGALEEEDEDEIEAVEEASATGSISGKEAVVGEEAEGFESAQEEEEEAEVAGASSQPRHSLFSYVITILLLGLLPMMAGYVFAATYDFIMNALNVNAFSPAFYPTLSVLSGLLPWRLAASVNLNNSNAGFILFTLFWRVPDGILGNPNLFDAQALESLLFSAVGLALLLIAMYDNHNPGDNQRRSAPWGVFLLLQALLGLVLVLPADLWLLRGLEGILKFQTLLAQLPTIQLLNPTLFVLNLCTGALFSLLVGVIVRRQYQLWTSPRVKTQATSTEKITEEEEEA